MGGWVGGWGAWLQYDKQVTSSSAKSLSVRTSVTIIKCGVGIVTFIPHVRPSGGNSYFHPPGTRKWWE